nr:aminotransferase class V-fold PLP-dependent enzyme [Litchfieldia alkalitelluris]
MEHHSNFLSWIETIGEVISLEPIDDGQININHLQDKLKQYQHRKCKIGAFTACSNVTGLTSPYHQLAKVMHEHGGICFIDFAASAPYVEIDMHPTDPLERLDGIMFSPHKFLGGPGSSGVLIVNSSIISNKVPDHPGGGTVMWTNPWGQYQYFPNLQAREDGGTPGFLQAIKIALCIQLKEQMGVSNIVNREKEMIEILLSELAKIPKLHIFEQNQFDRLAIISFYIEDIHHHLIVALLNDRFGIQVRGGCLCAGPYGHYLLNIDKKQSQKITDTISSGDYSTKPGWVRISLHPIMTNKEIYFIIQAVKLVVKNIDEWKKDYVYDRAKTYLFIAQLLRLM